MACPKCGMPHKLPDLVRRLVDEHTKFRRERDGAIKALLAMERKYLAEREKTKEKDHAH